MFHCSGREQWNDEADYRTFTAPDIVELWLIQGEGTAMFLERGDTVYLVGQSTPMTIIGFSVNRMLVECSNAAGESLGTFGRGSLWKVDEYQQFSFTTLALTLGEWGDCVLAFDPQRL